MRGVDKLKEEIKMGKSLWKPGISHVVYGDYCEMFSSVLYNHYCTCIFKISLKEAIDTVRTYDTNKTLFCYCHLPQPNYPINNHCLSYLFKRDALLTMS